MVLLPDGQRAAPRPRTGILRLIQFLASNAVALASLVVAVAALSLTIITNNRDAYYRELLIQPVLTLNMTPNFEVRIENRGLGPAYIRAATLMFNDKCYDLAKLSPTEFEAVLNELGRHFVGTVFQPMSPKLPTSNFSDAEFNIITPGIQLPQGQHKTIFSLTPAQFSMIAEALGSPDSGVVRQEVLHRYYRAALTYFNRVLFRIRQIL